MRFLTLLLFKAADGVLRLPKQKDIVVLCYAFVTYSHSRFRRMRGAGRPPLLGLHKAGSLRSCW